MSAKIVRFINRVTGDLKNDCHFSARLATVRLVENIIGRFVPWVSKRCSKYRNTLILKYLLKMLDGVLTKYKDTEDLGIYSENAPVWVCWWSGLEDAPTLVKRCVCSIQNAAGKHPVYIITRNNYFKYLEIPSYILEKIHSGKMCIANFTDYLRVSLLEKYGGLWLDATIYAAREISDDIFAKALYTCKSPSAGGYFSNGRWTSYCIGGWKNHLFFRMAKESFEIYWKLEETSIDYLLVDYVFAAIYNNNQFVKKCFDDIPINNMQRNELASAMVLGKAVDEFKKVITDETVFYKLSWREKYPEKTRDGKETIYGYFLSQKTI